MVRFLPHKIIDEKKEWLEKYNNVQQEVDIESKRKEIERQRLHAEEIAKIAKMDADANTSPENYEQFMALVRLECITSGQVRYKLRFKDYCDFVNF